MPKILFTCLHRPDRSPSQRFRFEQYLDFLKQNGFNYQFSYLLNAEDDKAFYAKGNYVGKFRILLKSVAKRMHEALLSNDYDIVFVQRECFMLGTSFFERQYAKKAKLVFDYDDSIWMQNISEGNKKLSFLKNADKTKEIIRASHLVLAGNQYLADYALQYNRNVSIFPTTIDTDLYTPRTFTQGGPICIGWSGSFTTIQHFEYALNALKKIKEKYGDKVTFKVIGDGSYYNPILGVKGLPWQSKTEVADLQSMDIGIMPLPDDEWAKGKCGLKGLQYMAVGVPTIMSPVGVNTEIIQDGENGFLAASDKEWVDKLSLLIESVELRKKFSDNGRRTVEGKYSVKANGEHYLQLFQTLLSGNEAAASARKISTGTEQAPT